MERYIHVPNGQFRQSWSFKWLKKSPKKARLRFRMFLYSHGIERSRFNKNFFTCELRILKAFKKPSRRSRLTGRGRTSSYAQLMDIFSQETSCGETQNLDPQDQPRSEMKMRKEMFWQVFECWTSARGYEVVLYASVFQKRRSADRDKTPIFGGKNQRFPLLSCGNKKNIRNNKQKKKILLCFRLIWPSFCR